MLELTHICDMILMWYFNQLTAKKFQKVKKK